MYWKCFIVFWQRQLLYFKIECQQLREIWKRQFHLMCATGTKIKKDCLKTSRGHKKIRNNLSLMYLNQIIEWKILRVVVHEMLTTLGFSPRNGMKEALGVKQLSRSGGKNGATLAETAKKLQQLIWCSYIVEPQLAACLEKQVESTTGADSTFLQLVENHSIDKMYDISTNLKWGVFGSMWRRRIKMHY